MDQNLINDIIQWDIKNWSKALPFWENNVKFAPPQKALALGERDGGLSLWLALKNIDVTCTDYKDFEQTPLDLHKKHQVDKNISYQQADAKSLPYANESFEIVIFKSMIGALENSENQLTAIKEAYRVLKPGGYLIFAENLQATKVHQFARNKFTSWGQRWYYPSITEIKEYCKDFNQFRYKAIGFGSPFGRTEKQRNFLSGIDSITNSITPNSWKYLLFGVATK